jgi:proline dehydrogenase
LSAADKALALSVPIIPRPMVRRISRRYTAGETLDDAAAVVRALNNEGCAATVDVLGEDVKDEARIAEKVRDYKRVVEALEEQGLDAGVSARPTNVGLALSKDTFRAKLQEIVAHAAERGRFVEVAMEDSPHTSATLETILDIHECHKNAGAVIQAYLRRSLGDVVRLAEAGVSVRLCKGIYDEPRKVAYKDFHTVRQNYILLLDELLRGGVYVGIATHDEFLIWHALRLIHQLEVPKDRYEFQMLLGVDEELRGVLVGAGHKLRVYVPFGEDWYEYSTRRLKENPRIAGYVARDTLNSLIKVGGR